MHDTLLVTVLQTTVPKGKTESGGRKRRRQRKVPAIKAGQGSGEPEGNWGKWWQKMNSHEGIGMETLYD